MTHLLECMPPGVGIDFDNDDAVLFNGTAVALSLGDVVVVDTKANTANAITGLLPLDATSGLWTHVRFSSTGQSGTGSDDSSSGWIVVAQEPIASGAKGRFRAHGDTLVNIASASPNFTTGQNLIINGTGGGQGTRFLTASGGDLSTSVKKVVAKSKAAFTTGATAQIVVTLNGISGFGGAG